MSKEYNDLIISNSVTITNPEYSYNPITKQFVCLEEKDNKYFLTINEVCHHFDIKTKMYLGYTLDYHYSDKILEKHK